MNDISTWVVGGSFGSPVIFNLRSGATQTPIKLDNPQSTVLIIQFFVLINEYFINFLFGHSHHSNFSSYFVSVLEIHAIRFDKEDNLWWAGSGGKLFKSENLTDLSSDMDTAYGKGFIRHVYSIAFSRDQKLSVAGSSNGILFSDNSRYWDSMVYI